MMLPDHFNWEWWNQVPRCTAILEPHGYRRYNVRLRVGMGTAFQTRLAESSKEFEAYLGRYLNLAQSPFSPDELHEQGGRLFEMFLAGRLRSALYRGWQSSPAATGKGSKATGPSPLRLRVELRDPLLHYLPWEYLHDPAGEPGSPQILLIVSRYTPHSMPPDPLPYDPPLKILVAACSPELKTGLNPSYELEQAASAIQAAAPGGQVEVTCLDNPLRSDLAQMLQKVRPHVLHLIANGFVSDYHGLLALRKDRSYDTDFLSAANLGALLPPGILRFLSLQTPQGAPNYQLAGLAGFAAGIDEIGLAATYFSQTPDSLGAFALLYAHLALGLPADYSAAQAIPPGSNLRLAYHQHTDSSQVLAVRGTSYQPPPAEQIESLVTQYEKVKKKASQSESPASQKVLKYTNQLVDILQQTLRQSVIPNSSVQNISFYQEEIDHLLKKMPGKTSVEPPPEIRSILAGSQATGTGGGSEENQQRQEEISFLRSSLARLYDMQKQFPEGAPEWWTRQEEEQQKRLTELIGKNRES